MTLESLWTAVGAVGTVLTLVVLILKAQFGSLEKAIGDARVEARDTADSLHARIDALTTHIDERYVRRETHDEVIRRLDTEINSVNRALNCARTRKDNLND